MQIENQTNDIAYFDSAATTFVKPQEVHNFMYEFYSANSVNIGRGNYSTNSFGARLIKETRNMLLELFDAKAEQETVFTPTATEALNTIIFGLNLKEKSIVYVSPFEHNAVMRPLYELQKIKEIKIIQLDVDKDTLEFKFEKIKKQFSDDKPSLVIVSHASNVCGNIAPVNEIGKIVKAFDATYVLDCCQTAGLLDISLKNNQADYLVFAGHKTLYGPFGCSGFICNKNTILKPLIFGGTGIDSVNENMPDYVPTKFEAGSQNIMAIAGLNASLKWIKKVKSINEIRKVENENYTKLINLLKKYDFIELVGVSKNTVGIISFTIKGLSPDNVGDIFNQNNILVRTGLQCSPIAHKFLGTYPQGTIRISTHYFQCASDFQLLKKILNYIKEAM